MPKLPSKIGSTPTRLALAGALLAAAAGPPTSFAPVAAQEAPYVSSRAAVARMKADVEYLADDARQGRGAGTQGLDEAAEYMAQEFRRLGLRPAPGANGYFQPFTVPGRVQPGTDNYLTAKGKDLGEGGEWSIPIRTGFTPLTLGSGGSFRDAEVVFAGYGITAMDMDLGLEYDDYDGIDVKGKVVVVLRREPQMNDETSKFAGKETTTYATFRHKVVNAFQQGAKALVLVNDKGSVVNGRDLLVPFSGAGGGGTDIPVFMATREVVDKWLAAAGEPSLEELEEQIDKDLKPASRALAGVSLTGSVDIRREDYKLKNVVGVLEGEGPFADETIVIGGHYDHLGDGVQGGSLARGSTDIHNGADDNASGTAMVLEMARRLAARPDKLPRRVVFMGFSGEELGLLGSRHYVNNPLYPIENTVFMFNFDMVGRLNERNELTLMGLGTSDGMQAICESLAPGFGLKVRPIVSVNEGVGGSDHQSFASKQVPILFAFTGLHADYHRPSDDPPTINYEGMGRIADFLEPLILSVIQRSERPVFTRPGRPAVARAETPAPAPAPAAAPTPEPAPAEPAPTPAPAAAPTPAPAPAAEATPTPAPAPARENPGAVRGARAYLGTQPDYGEEGVKGVKLMGVSEGSPAEKAGLKGGDVIVGLANKPISSLEDFMEALSRHKAGETIEIQVLRGKEELKLKAVLGTREAN